MEFLKDLPVAHRGLHDEKEPENSLAAFERAVNAGYAIETDVRFTKDCRLVLFHDDALGRMTGSIGNINDYTMSELKGLHLQNSAQKIPSIEEGLELIAGRVPLLIEIKNMRGIKPKEIAEALSLAMRGYRGAYAVQSFHPLYAKAYKALHPDVPCGLLGSAERGAASALQSFMVRRMPLNFFVRPDFLSYRAEDLPMPCTRRFAGPILAWTVRSPEEEARARKHANNIIFEGYLPNVRKES